MSKTPDLSKAKRGPVLSNSGKTRVTMYLDNDVLGAFRDEAEQLGVGYQTLINQTLKKHLTRDKPLDARTVRKIIREELGRTGT